jgi:hypothetical protein
MLEHELSKLLPKIVGRDDDFLLRSFSLRTKVTFLPRTIIDLCVLGIRAFPDSSASLIHKPSHLRPEGQLMLTGIRHQESVKRLWMQ